MSSILGVNLPDINITGFLSSTWIYVLIIALIGFLVVAGVAIILFYRVYNRKIVVFENISGQGYQPVLKTRARIVSLGVGGEEVLKTLSGGKYVTAYGRKMGKNTYWFAKGIDGYWYNCLLGDLDTKMSMLDIEPVDRDVRMFHVALDRLSQNQYDKKGFLEKYGMHMMLFLFLVVLIVGMWLIIGQVGKATAPLAAANDNQVKTTELNLQISERLDNIVTRMGLQNNLAPISGIVSVT